MQIYTQKEIAKELGVSVRTIQNKMKKLGYTGKIDEYMRCELLGIKPPPQKRNKKEDKAMSESKIQMITLNSSEVKELSDKIDNGVDKKTFINNLVRAYNWNVDMINDLKLELAEMVRKTGSATIQYSNGTLGKHPNVELINRVEKEQRQIIKVAQELDIIDGAEDVEFSFSFAPQKGNDV